MSPPTHLNTNTSCPGGPSVGFIASGVSRGELRGWWRPEDLPASGATATWADNSGNGFDFSTDAASTANPTVDTTTTLNGYRSLKFTPSVARDSMSADGPSIFVGCVREATMFWLTRRHTSATNANTSGAPAANAQENAAATHWPFSTDGRTYVRLLRDRNHRVNNLNLGTWVGTTYLVEVSTSQTDGWSMRRNGTVVATATHRWVNVTAADVVDEFRIGGNVANGFFGHPANYWEVLAYTGTPTTADRSTIHSYFNTKYGLALPT